MSLLVTENVDFSITAMRLLNLLISVGLLIAAALTLPRRQRDRTLAFVVAISVPLGIFLVSSISPSGLAAAALAATFIAAYSAARNPRASHAIAAAVTATVGVLVAMMSRPEAPVFALLLIASAAALAGIWRTRSVSRTFLLLLPPVLLALIGVARSLASRGAPADGQISFQTLPVHFVGDVANLLGNADTPVTALAWTGHLLAVAVVLGVGIRTAGLTKTASLTLLLLGAAAALKLWSTGFMGNSGEPLQSRILLPFLLCAAAALAISSLRDRPKLSRDQGIWLVVVAAGANLVALHRVLLRYTQGVEPGVIDLNQGAEWWPNPATPMFVWAIGSLSFLILMAILTRRAVGDRSQRFALPETRGSDEEKSEDDRRLRV